MNKGERVFLTPQAVDDMEREEKIIASLPPQERERVRNLFREVRKLEQTDLRTRIELDWDRSFVI
jgi:hypothetical protein